jgi:hypothetical protein
MLMAQIPFTCYHPRGPVNVEAAILSKSLLEESPDVEATALSKALSQGSPEDLGAVVLEKLLLQGRQSGLTALGQSVLKETKDGAALAQRA